MDPILSRLMVRDIPPVPKDVVEAFETGTITHVPIEERSRILTDPSLRMENGIHESIDGTVQVAVSCHMEGVTLEMIEWWGWWSPGDSDRFRAWLPDSNIRLTYSEEDADYFRSPYFPGFRPVTLYPEQVVGDIPMPFRIDMYPPDEFGFTDDVIVSAGDPLVYCCRLGAKKGRIMYSWFVYMFFPEGDGCRFSARFWVGSPEGNRFLKILLLNRRRMSALGIGCYREYTSLPGVLPELYAIYGGKV